jgi:transcription-repair coupling factor (superfamily II helicase)
MMGLDFLARQIGESAIDLIEIIRTRHEQPGLGLRRSARLAFLAALRTEIKRPILFLTDRSDHALTIQDELGLWMSGQERLFFPEPNPLFYEQAAWGENTRRDRLIVLTTLASYHIPGATIPEEPPVIIASARAVMARSLPRREFLKASRSIKPRQVINLDEILRTLFGLGYDSVNTVIASGQFARRGGILDIWPPAEPMPVRIEFFGDEIDTLRCFEPSTQRTIRSIDRVLVTPAREYMAIKDDLEFAKDPITGEINLSEFYIPYLHSTPTSVLDYLPQATLVLVDNLRNFQDTINEIEEQALSLRRDYQEDGTLAKDFPVPYLTFSEIEDSLTGHQVLELGPYGSTYETRLAQLFTPGPRFGGRLKDLLGYMLDLYQSSEQIVIVSRQKARLEELWHERARAAGDLKEGLPKPIFLEGSLTEGWTFAPSEAKPVHLLTDGEIFGWRRPEPRRRHRAMAEAPEAPYADLQIDDWVVHVDHGIGRFVGLVSRTVEGLEREYLCIEYAENDQLYVPVYQADRLTRYVGPDSRPPSPTRLGGAEWTAAKERTQKAVAEIAQDLLELHARRQVVQGISFIEDTAWQQELEASFPYVETEDQLQVIREVKQDMESSRPMDRLICGDVGYGKTEVALRAAFKAVMSGKQVAVLVPTTVLAQQHYHTFRERTAAYPVEVEMLSRFRNPQQQQEIIQRLANGNLDIVIGTHRLIQGDVEIKDLGLLIIDEEQRFGVTHKEKLKQMRSEVDVLTMTATPIPRTLYMALTGVRDISTINTPPEERLPVITHVGPYSPRLVRQAILREMERGGQVFFVHNRVQTIGAMLSHLAKLVPEVRIAVAHGQMAEGELSARMEKFAAGEVDVLLSTSIIESGLDIPNANTLIIDRADAFGLAQLYQLRGRVGRGAQRAYAYFFRHRRKLPTPEGRERMETIAENTQLGAGYSIAMRDLEIRGTGDILGTRQHGHIAAVGFHLYTRLLADAVRRLRESHQFPEATPEEEHGQALLAKGAQEAQAPLINVDLPLHLSIPSDYVPDKSMRLRLYRRIANLKSLGEVDSLSGEFYDRFGPLPEPVKNLFFQVKVKILAEAASLSAVSGENGQIVLRYPPLPEGITSRSFPYFGPDVRTGKNSLWVKASQPDWHERLIEILSELEQHSSVRH